MNYCTFPQFWKFKSALKFEALLNYKMHFFFLHIYHTTFLYIGTLSLVKVQPSKTCHLGREGTRLMTRVSRKSHDTVMNNIWAGRLHYKVSWGQSVAICAVLCQLENRNNIMCVYLVWIIERFVINIRYNSADHITFAVVGWQGKTAKRNNNSSLFQWQICESRKPLPKLIITISLQHQRPWTACNMYIVWYVYDMIL